MNEDSEPDLLELDGSAGGGQLLRTALGLSMATGRAFQMRRVRGSRPTPGLKPQHLAAVRAAASVCDATVSGDELGSETVTFRPGAPTGGRVEIDIETAGSVTLAFDALLPVALGLDRPLVVAATGGTDVKWSPTIAHYRRAKLRLLREWGLFAAVEREQVGFYPAGGGRATLLLAPSSPSRLERIERGDLEGARIYSTESADLADRDVAARQAANAAESLRNAEIPVVERTISTAETPSTGSTATVVLDYEETVAGFDALGERGTPAEEVGARVVDAAVSFHRRDSGPDADSSSDTDSSPDAGDGAAAPSPANATTSGNTPAVDAHTADQLVVFLALCGGRVTVPEVTDHVRTGIDLVAEFGLDVTVIEGSPPTLVAEGH
ncbi:RNA 3'-terminal phosphate cyclase [Halorussus amylolyticus]|uniref:RNA 3'-terminal phosphate cyclase n=1 Tax=Halorussus amylolyticus TaxID=1126242 RepID=UPI001049D063|nr:RNA 3'-terminal phosphate cyclase [Halorussus amylolyticus]